MKRKRGVRIDTSTLLPMPREAICICGTDFRQAGAVAHIPLSGDLTKTVYECPQCGLYYHMDAKRARRDGHA